VLTANAGTVGELVELWYSRGELEWSPTKANGYRSIIDRRILPRWGNVALRRLRTADLDAWHSELRRRGGKGGQPLAPNSVKRIHAVLRTALAQAVRWGWIATNPASNAPIEHPKRQQQRTLTSEEVRAVIAAAAEVHEMAPLAFRLSAEMGARRSELAALRWDKFAGDKVVVDGQIIVSTDADGVRAARFKPTKTGNRRVVTPGSALLAMVEEARAKYGEATTWLFTPDADPPNPDRIGWWWRRSRELAGIDRHWHLHDLRVRHEAPHTRVG